jgi:hypothetical protein
LERGPKIRVSAVQFRPQPPILERLGLLVVRLVSVVHELNIFVRRVGVRM